MTPRASLLSWWVLASAGLLTVACSPHDDAPVEPSGGVSGAAGASDVAGTVTFKPPVEIADPPEMVGASPVSCSGKTAVKPAVVRACALLGSCSPFPSITSLSDCIAQALPTSGLYPDCVNGAQSCAEMDVCLGTGFSADGCGVTSGDTHCVGSKAMWCGAPSYYHDCAALGAKCSEYSSNDDGTLDAADCSVVAACTTPSELYTCSGTKRFRCEHGIGFGEDCAAKGMVCVPGAEGAVCAKKPAGCATPGSGSCDAAGNGSYCTADGRAVALDCTGHGLTCRQATESALGVECVAPGCAPADAAKCFEECDGTLAHLCVGGQRLSIDCQAYGLRDCTLESRPEGGDRARCGYD